MGDELELNQSPIRFSIFTRSWDPIKADFAPTWLKAFKDVDGKMMLSGIASSTVKDLHGDTMLASALEDMERDANNNLTIFGNHEYKVPEDVYGSVRKASIRPAGMVDAAGDPIYDLDFDIAVNQRNKRAVESWESIDDGAKIGLSIGAMIPEGGATRNKKTGAYTIAHVNLLETSMVGIPANPRSWVQNAVKSLLDTNKAATTTSLGQPQLTLDSDKGTYKIEGNLADVATVSFKGIEGEVDVPEGAVLVSKHEECGESIEGAFADGICSKCGSTGPFTAEYVVRDVAGTTSETVVTPDIALAACPDCGRSDDGKGCQNPFHKKDVDPDVTDAKVTIIEVDTGTPAAAAADEDVDDDSDVEASATIEAVKSVLNEGLDESIAGTVQTLLELTNTLMKELGDSKTRETQALAAKAAAEQERDTVIRTAGDLIGKTNALIQKLGDLRVGPKTLVKDAHDELDDLRGIYTSAFLDMLKS